MARQEADREDLLGEATAYVERIEWLVGGEQQAGLTVFAGFRQGGAASFYFGADPVFHFNAAGQLRRAFHEGVLLKAEGGKLVRLERRRSDSEVTLVHTELTPQATGKFLQQVQQTLCMLRAALEQGTAKSQGQHPVGSPIAARVLDWLQQHRETAIANSPHARS